MTVAGPTLSVVVACRNAAAHLPRLLEALAGETVEGGFEVIVVDNGSTDDTRAVAEGFADRLPGLRVVDASATAGQWYASNVGVAAADGAGIVFLDSDDQFAPGYLAEMAAGLRESELVGPTLDVDRLNPGWITRSRRVPTVDGLIDIYGFLPYINSVAIRADAFNALGGYANIPPSQDVDLCWRAQLRGMRLTAVPGAVLYYRYRDTMGGIYQQAVGYGAAEAALYRRFRRHGMPRSAPASLKDIWYLGRHAKDRGDWAYFVFVLGVHVGRLKGSVRNRVVFL
ncbi:MAG: hypothetical protein QOE92_119 [Chloroflexota bacterium]|nr:hypothetical protein [Chloroflexota bacterium]